MADDNINKRGNCCKSFDAEVCPRQASLILLESKLKRLTSGRKRVAKVSGFRLSGSPDIGGNGATKD